MKKTLLPLTVLLLAACGGETAAPPADTAATAPPAAAAPSDKTLTLYSGRNEKLIGPLIQRFTETTGIKVETRYGETAEMAATLLEEGANTPADVFFSQDAGALGAITKSNLAKPLPEDVVSKVPARFAGPNRSWVGVSGRARTVVYNPKKLKPEELPQSLEEVADRKWAGRWGVAPLNASFQAQMAVYNALNGPEALDRLLQSMVKAKPRRYPRNSAIVEAVASGEIAWGLVNHYYAWEAKRENAALPVENFFMPKGDASSFVNVAGVALLDDQDGDAIAFVRFLLENEAQTYFASRTFEYPLVAGVPASVALQPLDQLRTPDIDFARVSEVLPETLAKINESGLARR